MPDRDVTVNLTPEAEAAVGGAAVTRGDAADPDAAGDAARRASAGVHADDLEALLRRAVVHVLDHAHAPDAEVSLTLLDDDAVRGMNRTYLGKDRPTDVIAFSLGDDERIVGDVYLGADQARRQAEALGIGLAEELVRLAIHGTLHVLGHDHPEGEDRERSPMYVLQERLLREVSRAG